MTKELLPKTMPGLNIEEALQRIGIPAEVFKTILLKFAETNSDKIEAMRQGLKDGCLADVGLLAHALKGASSNIGANALCDAALVVGQSVKAEVDIEELAKVVEALIVELDIVLGSLAILREGK